jgi:hypothetical protein
MINIPAMHHYNQPEEPIATEPAEQLILVDEPRQEGEQLSQMSQEVPTPSIGLTSFELIRVPHPK